MLFSRNAEPLILNKTDFKKRFEYICLCSTMLVAFADKSLSEHGGTLTHFNAHGVPRDIILGPFNKINYNINSIKL